MPGNSNRGIALPLVIGVIAIVTALGFTAAFLVDSQATMSQRHFKGEQALAYAEGGLSKYLWHLNKDSKYYEVDEADKGEHDAKLEVDTEWRDGWYRLEVDPPTTDVPAVTIRATGWSGLDPTNRRTIEVLVRKRQFVQQVYMSNAEVLVGTSTPVWWITDDEVYGPLHTNGTLNISGTPSFFGPVTYSGSLNVQAGSNPHYGVTPPQQVASLVFPPSNTQLKTQAQFNGYYYTGRTSIRLDGDQVIIRNKTDAAVTRPLPANGVIYVDNEPGGVVSNKWDTRHGNAFVSGTLDGRLTIAAARDIFVTGRDPTVFTWSSAPVTGGITYDNTDFAPGLDMTDDMLGLVSANYVRILHYEWFGGSGDVAPTDITIHAAVFALNYSWEYERYDEGGLKGTITLVGSIIQQNRGAVGTFSSSTGNRLTGYLKDYSHDPRMAYDTPPHFLEPVNAGWEIISWRLLTNP